MKRVYILILLVIVLFSYGQILRMSVWQDDNALFFKLAHVSENAGYLATGPFGVGAYKYIQTPYIPIYNLFGYKTVYYFAFTLIAYFLATVCVYKTYKELLGKTGGRIAGLLFAAGYIASDGIIRLFNSISTSMSIIAASIMIVSYWRYFQEKKIKWYVLSVILYFLSVELVISRTHYLIGVIVTFELLYFQKQKSFFKSLLKMLLRLSPFFFIFYKYFIANTDQRSANVGKFVIGLLKGEYYQIYGFLSSVTNIYVPDWITNPLTQNLSYRSVLFIILLVFLLLTFSIFRKRKSLFLLSFSAIFVWTFIAKQIILVPQVNPNSSQILMTILGGDILIFLASLIFNLEPKYKKIYTFFLIWTLINIAAYSAYNPLVVYESVNRYFAHSFYALVGLFSILFIGMKKNKASQALKLFIIIWGVGNLLGSVSYQRNILNERSYPTIDFYQQLKEQVPTVSKGDVFYFDVNEKAQRYFENAFSVASMPETTAIAWRYGVDRYDLKLFTDFSKLNDYLSVNKISKESVYTFNYQKNSLINTTEQFRKLYFEKSSQKEVAFDSTEGVVDFREPISSVASPLLTLDIVATPVFTKNQSTQPSDSEFEKMTFEYLKFKNNILENAKYSSSSQWQDRVIGNIHDKDTDTVWQPDRILWHDKKQEFQIDLGSEIEIDRFVWINGFGNNTPTNYYIETSPDNKNWQTNKSINSIVRIDAPLPQVVKFSPVKARFIRMRIVASLNDDAPGISEAWVVPVTLTNLDIERAETFLQKPFTGISNQTDFNKILSLSNYTGTAQFYWIIDDDNWKTKIKNKINIVYDGKAHSYTTKVPAGGISIKKIKLSDFTIPGSIVIKSIKVNY